MTTSVSKNLSHRQLITQKTHELLYYHQCVRKPSKVGSTRAPNFANLSKNDHDHQTSINLDQSVDTSLSKRLEPKKGNNSRSKISEVLASKEMDRKLLHIRKRPNITSYKSVEIIPSKKSNQTNIQKSFSVKKLVKNKVTNSQSKLESLQSLQHFESSKKIQVFEPAIPRSETDLKQTLKKTTASKLKLKVKDPFERRMKLDIEFKDQSVIEKMQDSLNSTLNQEELRDLLTEMQ